MSSVIEDAKKEGAVPKVSTRTIFFMITHGGSFPMAIPTLTNDLPGRDIRSKRALKEHADAIVQLLEDDKLRSEFGQRGKQKIESECSPEVVGRKTLAVYRKAARGEP